MERRVVALESEASMQASNTRRLTQLVEDSMPVGQCHELLAGLEQRLASSKLPAAAAATDGRSAVADALHDDMCKLMRSQANLEQITRSLGGRLGRVEATVSELSSTAVSSRAADALLEQNRAEHPIEDVLRAQLAESEQRLRDELTEALGQELAEAVQEMADIAEAMQQVAEQSVQKLTDRLQQSEDAAVHTIEATRKILAAELTQITASFNSVVGQHQADLAKLRTSTAQESQRSSHVIERLQVELQECREQNLDTLSELRALETLRTAFETNKDDRKEEADGLLGEVEAFVTEQLQESERRQQQQTVEFMETRLAPINQQAVEEHMNIQEQLHASEAAWKRSRQDDAGHIERAVRSLERAIGEQESEYKRKLSSLESTLSHTLKLQADTHEQQCAELKREIADVSAVLRREQTDSVAQAQLEAQSSNRGIALLRYELEQSQLRVANTMDGIIARSQDERRESLLQVDARILQISAESRDIVASSKRSFERLEHAKDTLTRQLAEGNARERAERERLSSQVNEALKTIEHISNEEVAARNSLAQSLVQQIAESARTAASTTDALESRLDTFKVELEGMVTREFAAYGALLQTVRTDVELQLDEKTTELSKSLYEQASEMTTRIATVEAKATGRMERLQTELNAHHAESVLAMSTHDERLSTMVVELTATVENHAQGLHADIVSCRTAAQDQLKQAMADVDKLLSSKSDITVVEQLILGLDKHAAKLNLLSDRLELFVDASSTANNRLRDEIAVANQAVQKELRGVDKAMRSDFLKSSIGIRKDFATADSKTQQKLVELIGEVRQLLEETMQSCVSKTEIQVQLGTMKIDLNETRSAIKELEERTETLHLQSDGVGAELAELAVELSLIDATTSTMALSS